MGTSPIDRVSAELLELRKQVNDLRGSEKVIVFIDNTNLAFTARKIDSDGRYRLCYVKLLEMLADKRFLKQSRLYYSDFSRIAKLSDEESLRRQDREGFYNFLKCQGFWLKSCDLVGRDDGTTKEKGLDAAITKDIERLTSSQACDTVILVAGDADYSELIADVQSSYGVRVEIAFFAQYTAKSLQYNATKFIDLTPFKEKLRRSQS